MVCLMVSLAFIYLNSFLSIFLFILTSFFSFLLQCFLFICLFFFIASLGQVMDGLFNVFSHLRLPQLIPLHLFHFSVFFFFFFSAFCSFFSLFPFLSDTVSLFHVTPASFVWCSFAITTLPKTPFITQPNFISFQIIRSFSSKFFILSYLHIFHWHFIYRFTLKIIP